LIPLWFRTGSRGRSSAAAANDWRPRVSTVSSAQSPFFCSHFVTALLSFKITAPECIGQVAAATPRLPPPEALVVPSRKAVTKGSVLLRSNSFPVSDRSPFLPQYERGMPLAGIPTAEILGRPGGRKRAGPFPTVKKKWNHSRRTTFSRGGAFRGGIAASALRMEKLREIFLDDGWNVDRIGLGGSRVRPSPDELHKQCAQRLLRSPQYQCGHRT
jgi:hypothetical protein